MVSAGLAFAALAVPSLAAAQGYPSRPITFISDGVRLRPGCDATKSRHHAGVQ